MRRHARSSVGRTTTVEAFGLEVFVGVELGVRVPGGRVLGLVVHNGELFGGSRTRSVSPLSSKYRAFFANRKLNGCAPATRSVFCQLIRKSRAMPPNSGKRQRRFCPVRAGCSSIERKALKLRPAPQPKERVHHEGDRVQCTDFL